MLWVRQLAQRSRLLDLDKDGDTTEPMKNAAKNKTQGNAKGGAIKKMAGGGMTKKMMAKGKMVKGGAKAVRRSLKPR